MKKIIKQSEPRSLVEHRSKQRANQNADYENYPKKDDLRKSLLEEQGYICCYCMSRITSEQMKIEHWKPQTKYTSL
ncbi:MAG: TIGR02646 family protein, partial [Pseudanabaena sp.]